MTFPTVPGPSNQTCNGPSHGNAEALPRGIRRWFAGNCMSLTQVSTSGTSYHIFCGPTCLCDWHGVFDAALQSAPADHDPPGRFTLVWIGLSHTTVATYDDWEALTGHIGSYQKTLIDQGLI